MTGWRASTSCLTGRPGQPRWEFKSIMFLSLWAFSIPWLTGCLAKQQEESCSPERMKIDLVRLHSFQQTSWPETSPLREEYSMVAASQAANWLWWKREKLAGVQKSPGENHIACAASDSLSKLIIQTLCLLSCIELDNPRGLDLRQLHRKRAPSYCSTDDHLLCFWVLEVAIIQYYQANWQPILCACLIIYLSWSRICILRTSDLQACLSLHVQCHSSHYHCTII